MLNMKKKSTSTNTMLGDNSMHLSCSVVHRIRQWTELTIMTVFNLQLIHKNKWCLILMNLQYMCTFILLRKGDSEILIVLVPFL